MGMDQDDLVLAPYSAVMKRILAITYVQSISCSALTEDLTDKATEEITSILRSQHKLRMPQMILKAMRMILIYVLKKSWLP